MPTREKTFLGNGRIERSGRIRQYLSETVFLESLENGHADEKNDFQIIKKETLQNIKISKKTSIYCGTEPTIIIDYFIRNKK